MKRFFILASFFATAFTSFSQSLGYQDLGILFSQNDHNGSARFTAMSGAFGALGGDISSINVNPAGLSVFNNSMFTGSFNARSSDITSVYGNQSLNRTAVTTQDQFINLSQAGAVLVFDSAHSSNWSKFAIGFNYRITKDFNNSFLAEGNSGFTTFTNFPKDTNDPALIYDFADEQGYNNTYGGKLSEFNVAFSSVHQNKLHLGVSLNFYDLNFSQQSTLSEFNSDIDGNTLDAFLYQENFTTGTGFSANIGFIYKAHQNFRFGLSYKTPTYFTEIIEDSNITENEVLFGDAEIVVSDSNDTYRNTDLGGFPLQSVIYRFRTPSTLTASTAFIFGKNGLLSFDYNNKNFQRMRLSGDDFSPDESFSNENQFFQNNLKNTHNFNIGTEWRFDRFSVRGGYSFEQTPHTTSGLTNNSITNFGDIEGYSLGGGYNFGNFKLDFAYSNNNRTAAHSFYSGFNNSAANLTIDNSIFTASVSLSL
ncbi:hemin receptor [Polaribacter sp. IC066]|uniref:OmpP1/FadL family transporter n=1 Tax=Polaribacter sp. IC066 TaxID=57032 RepID=UPI0011BDB569|nr:hemin receptor [Polaribacter sp. IC066]TXD62402.1 hemin receptor [Polaribacter sp. IC066]